MSRESEKPILFNTEMVKAILSGQKKQTRRIIKPQPIELKMNDEKSIISFLSDSHLLFGSVLWVRENWNIHNGKYYYQADNPEGFYKWRPSIHMPYDACRLKLKINDIKIERINAISDFDISKEGVKGEREYFKFLWDSIYAKAKPIVKKGTVSHYESFPFDNESKIICSESVNADLIDVYVNPYVYVIHFEPIE